MKIKNISESVQMLPNFSAFQAGEERTVSPDEAKIILRNSNFEQVKAEVKKEVKKEKKSFNN